MRALAAAPRLIRRQLDGPRVLGPVGVEQRMCRQRRRIDGHEPAPTSRAARCWLCPGRVSVFGAAPNLGCSARRGAEALADGTRARRQEGRDAGLPQRRSGRRRPMHRLVCAVAWAAAPRVQVEVGQQDVFAALAAAYRSVLRLRRDTPGARAFARFASSPAGQRSLIEAGLLPGARDPKAAAAMKPINRRF